MAEPVIPGGIRAVVLVPNVNGLPRDQVVNVWHFRQKAGAGGITQAMFEEVHTRLTEFYTTPPTEPAGMLAVGAYWSAQVPTTTAAIVTKMYDLGAIPPRQVGFQGSFTRPALTGTSTLPMEVAVCASFYAIINAARRRGRIYFGPLTQTANANGLVAVPLRDALMGAMRRLRNTSAGAGLTEWAVMGMADGVAVNTPRGANTHVLRSVTAGWVDDAFDTQRRRGVKSTTRAVV